MCDEKYKLYDETLSQFKKYVTEYNYEICANLNKIDKNNEKILLIDKNSIMAGTSKDDSGRALCVWKNKDNLTYLFHSHPINSRSYPSMEDVIKVLKRNSVFFSSIGTRWGLYVIKPTMKSFQIAKDWETYNLEKQYSPIILYHLNKIGIIENDLGYKKGLYPDLNNYQIQIIKDILVDIEKSVYLSIKFCPWNSLNL